MSQSQDAVSSKTFTEKLGRDGLILMNIFIVFAGILLVVTIALVIIFCRTRKRKKKTEAQPGMEDPEPVETPLSPGRTYLVLEQDRRSRISNFSMDFDSFYSDSHVKMRDIPIEVMELSDKNTIKECPSEKGKRLSNRISILSAPSFSEHPEKGATSEETAKSSVGKPGTIQSDGSMLI